MTDAERQQRTGRDLLDRGRPREAIEPLERALALDPGLGHAWHALGLAYCLTGAIDRFMLLVDRSWRLFESGLVYFHNVVLDLMEREAWDALLGLPERVTRKRPERALAVYYAGCAELARSRYPAAFERFSDFKADVLANLSRYPVTENENMNVVFRQGTLIEPPEVVARIVKAESAPFRAAASPIFVHGGLSSAGPGPFLLAACDAVYFRRFAMELTASIAGQCPDRILHFHVIEPEDSTFAGLARIRNSAPDLAVNLTLERGPHVRNPVYYACSRFLAAPHLIGLYRRDALVIDVDSRVLDDLADVIEATRGLDFACFNTGRLEPASMYSAALLYAADSSRSLRFLDLLGRFALLKLDQPPALTWMLDQAALFSALRYVADGRLGLAFGELERLTGRPLDCFLASQGTMEEKRGLMNP